MILPDDHGHWRIVFAGGGTGGHLIPGLALAEEVLRRDPYADIVFVGMEGGIEERLVPAYGYRLARVLKRPHGGGGAVQLARKVWSLWGARKRCIELYEQHHPQVVVGLGGYASAAPMLAARSLELPIVLMEQNAIPGRANRWLGGLANVVGVQFEECSQFFPKKARLAHVGNPVLRATLEDGASRVLGTGRVLLVIGGSQGARPINEVLASSAANLGRALPGLEIIALTGEEDAARVHDALVEANVRGRVIPFSTRMGGLYAYADLVLARAGATTIAELTALGLPSLLVPYPHAADNHQEANARILERAGAATVIDQSELTTERLTHEVCTLLGDAQRLAGMGSAARRMGCPDAAVRAVNLIADCRQERLRKGA